MDTMTTAIRERPILFSGPMVRAILDGRKTQTRRVVKLAAMPGEENLRLRYIDGRIWRELKEQEYDPHTKKTIYGGECRLEDDCLFYAPIVVGKGPRGEGNPARCKYGEVGDRLWVREGVIQIGHERTGRNGQYFWPKFDDEAKARRWFDSCCEYTVDLKGPNDPTYIEPHGTLNKLFMPRWASRLTLEVTGVRVERLNEISDSDVQAEGAIADRGDGETWYAGKCQDIFAQLWDSINGKSHPWASNPWVWVVEFRRVEAIT